MAKDKTDKPKKTKYLTAEEAVALQKTSSQDLLRDFLTQTKAIRDIKKQKKEDSGLNKLKDEVKMHRETTVSDKLRSELKELKDREKGIKMEIDEGIEDQLAEIKETNADYREKAGYANEKLRLVQAILDARGE